VMGKNRQRFSRKTRTEISGDVSEHWENPRGHGFWTDTENGGGFLDRESPNGAENEDVAEDGKQA
jgi:hypothetical protein